MTKPAESPTANITGDLCSLFQRRACCSGELRKRPVASQTLAHARTVSSAGVFTALNTGWSFLQLPPLSFPVCIEGWTRLPVFAVVSSGGRMLFSHNNASHSDAVLTAGYDSLQGHSRFQIQPPQSRRAGALGRQASRLPKRGREDPQQSFDNLSVA